MKAAARAAGAQVVAAEFLGQFFVAVDDAPAALDLGLGGEAPAALTGHLERRRGGRDRRGTAWRHLLSTSLAALPLERSQHIMPRPANGAGSDGRCVAAGRVPDVEMALARPRMLGSPAVRRTRSRATEHGRPGQGRHKTCPYKSILSLARTRTAALILHWPGEARS